MEKHCGSFAIGITLGVSDMIKLLYRSPNQYLVAVEMIVANVLLCVKFEDIDITPIRKRLPTRIIPKIVGIGLCASIVVFVPSLIFPAIPPITIIQHPIEELIRTSRARFEETLAKQSRTLAEAVQEYRARTGRYPPPHFDAWYEFAKSHNVQMIDEYDNINHLITPFWGVSPATIRENVRDTVTSEDRGRILPLFIRNGELVKPEHGWNPVPEEAHWPVLEEEANLTLQVLTQMMRKFVHHLPDMEILFNLMDEPSLVMPNDLLNQLVQTAKKERQTEIRSNYFSELPVWKESPLHYGYDYVSLGQTMAYRQITQSCPLDSPARQINGRDLVSSYTLGPLGFIHNISEFLNPCNQPSLRYHHGFFDRPSTLFLYSSVLPIFSQSKIGTFNDLLFPSLLIYTGSYVAPVDESQDMEWELKRDQMHWRGTSTGGDATVGGLWRNHRQRFVKAMDNITNPVKILKKVDNGWIEDLMSPAAAQELFDVKFTMLVQGSGSAVYEMEMQEFDIAPYEDQQQLWKWKFLLDVDGFAWSGRFSELLKSKSLVFHSSMFQVWYDPWLWPWVHYVPLGLNGSDWFESVRFFAQEETGKHLAKRMAYESSQWAKSVLRKEDAEVWLFRMLLE